MTYNKVRTSTRGRGASSGRTFRADRSEAETEPPTYRLGVAVLSSCDVICGVTKSAPVLRCTTIHLLHGATV